MGREKHLSGRVCAELEHLSAGALSCAHGDTPMKLYPETAVHAQEKDSSHVAKQARASYNIGPRPGLRHGMFTLHVSAPFAASQGDGSSSIVRGGCDTAFEAGSRARRHRPSYACTHDHRDR